MKSMDLATSGSRLSVGKLTNTCLFNRNAGIVQNLLYTINLVKYCNIYYSLVLVVTIQAQ